MQLRHQDATLGASPMTHDPHLPTLELVMNGNPFEIIDTPWGQMEAWRASTMATGTMGALAQVAAIVRNDVADLQEKSVAFDAKKSAVLRTVNRLLSFMSRVDALTARMEALEAKHRADEERQREFEEPIEEPPGTEEPQADDTQVPGGELHALARTRRGRSRVRVTGASRSHRHRHPTVHGDLA